MAGDTDNPRSFLGRGWAFPPRFMINAPASGPPVGEVAMTADEEDVAASLKILFGTAKGARIMVPDYGLDLQEILFDAISTTMRTFLKDRIKTAILIHEPRINLLGLDLVEAGGPEGRLTILVEYAIRATNSRYNLVFPFYRQDGNELRGLVDAASPVVTGG